MGQEVFIIQNVSTNDIEIKDFGLIIPPDVSLDLGDFDRSILSPELDGYLTNGDIIRFINGVSVGYEEVYQSSTQPIDSPTFSYVDGSLSDLRFYVDGSINILKSYTDGSLNLKVNQTLFDSSILSLTTKNLNQDISINSLRVYTDGSLNTILIENDVQDSSIISLRNEDIRQDGSLNLLFLENDIQDSSIIRIDSSITNLYNTKVDRAGDTMTGDLIISGAGLDVSGDASFGQNLYVSNKIRLAEYDNIDCSVGDLWRDPSGPGHLYYCHPIEGLDASSYDLVDRLLRTGNDWQNFPDSSTLDPGDRILIEDAQDGFKKKYISADAFAQAAAQLLFPAYDDNKPQQSTTSTTYINALTLTTDPSAISSTYRIGWTLQIANSKNGKDSSYRVLVDGSILLEEQDVTAIASNSFTSFSGFEFVYLDSTTDPSGHIVAIDYHASPGSTAYIQFARLEFRKADVET